MTRWRRWVRQWRESWADAAFDDVREELVRIQFVHLAMQRDLARLRGEVEAIKKKDVRV